MGIGPELSSVNSCPRPSHCTKDGDACGGVMWFTLWHAASEGVAGEEWTAQVPQPRPTVAVLEYRPQHLRPSNASGEARNCILL